MSDQLGQILIYQTEGGRSRIEVRLAKGRYGRVATVSADGSPYCTPLLYVWMDGAIYLHNSAAPGHLRDAECQSIPVGSHGLHADRAPRRSRRADVPAASVALIALSIRLRKRKRKRERKRSGSGSGPRRR